MSAGHQQGPALSGATGDFRRRLAGVAAISFGMFVVALTAGAAGGSQALMADALDFLAFGVAYALSLWAQGLPERRRADAALGKDAILFALGTWIAAATLYRFFVRDVPAAEVMAAIGFVALAANALSAYVLFAYRAGSAEARTIWLATRNDGIGNVAVLVAAGLVALLNSSAPDLIVAGVMVVLFLGTTWQSLMRSWKNWAALRVTEAPADPAPERENP